MKILVTGSTGLVGQGVLKACQASAAVARLAVLVRKGGDAPAGVEEIVLADFLQAAAVAPLLAGFDACFYCAGAPPVGTPEAEYRHVTVDATLAVARVWAEANPEGRFLYVSGAYADPNSRVMPLRIKGEAERALSALAITTVMLRPGGRATCRRHRHPAWRAETAVPAGRSVDENGRTPHSGNGYQQRGDRARHVGACGHACAAERC